MRLARDRGGRRDLGRQMHDDVRVQLLYQLAGGGLAEVRPKELETSETQAWRDHVQTEDGADVVMSLEPPGEVRPEAPGNPGDEDSQGKLTT